ncbi:MAG: hypothetical protein LAT82_00345 [Nanoarchaeota archaeon]|nr:hypothetical protein [Nanoarchaeota archaeon]
MNKIMITILMIISLIFAGCSSNSDEQNSQDIRENMETMAEKNGAEVPFNEEQLNEVEETISESLENIQNVEQEVLEDRVVFDDENSTLRVEDGRVIAQVNRSVDFEARPFSEWCINGETYTFEGEDGDIESVIQGVSTHNGIQVCEAHHTMVQETPIGTFEINTVYFINEDITKLWIVTDFMGQVSETEIELQ